VHIKHHRSVITTPFSAYSFHPLESFLLGSVMPLWLGTLIVGVVSVGIAYALCVAGRKKLQTKSMTLDRTREMIERAPSAVTGNESEARRGR
jgi:hypothetical protein